VLLPPLAFQTNPFIEKHAIILQHLSKAGLHALMHNWATDTATGRPMQNKYVRGCDYLLRLIHLLRSKPKFQ
jgi:DNA-directed RNA polymerase beta subunit